MNNTILLNLANQQIQLIILNALNYLTKLRKLSYENSMSTTHLLTYQTRYRLYDIQYSFCLHDPCLNKRNQQLIQLNTIENFADNFIANLFQTSLHEVEFENDEPSQSISTINSYVDQFIESTITQAMSNIIRNEIENFSTDLTENILDDALLTIADDELYTRWRLTNENTSIEQQQQQYRDNQLISLDTLVNNLAQNIYFRSFDNLRKIFTNNSLND